MPVKYRSWYQYKEHGHGGEKTLTDAKQIDGFWVPIRVVWSAPMIGDASQIQERTYTVSRFSLGKVVEADLKVDMRPGAEVIDGSTGIAYKLDADGKATAKPLGDSKSGNARTATEAELAEALEINPIKDDISDSAVARRKMRVAEVLARIEARRRAEDPVLDKAAPAFPAQAIWHNGDALTWDQLKGKVVILHFFAEWCGPCKNDYPMLVQLHSNKGGNLVIIGIHAAGSEAEKVKKLLQDYKISYPVCEDVAAGKQKGWGQMFAAMGAKMAPHAILVNAQGQVVERGTLMDIYDGAVKLLAAKK
jgi:thiol-disulfide isomerase/thioredoxin